MSDKVKDAMAAALIIGVGIVLLTWVAGAERPIFNTMVSFLIGLGTMAAIVAIVGDQERT